MELSARNPQPSSAGEVPTVPPAASPLVGVETTPPVASPFAESRTLPPASASTPEAGTVPPSATVSADTPCGAVSVPGYEILGELGRGGMGVVYRARQVKANRVVALKMILAQQHASLEQKVRFQIEAEAIARLQHANLVPLYEVGEHGGLPFFTLKLCDGGALDRKL